MVKFNHSEDVLEVAFQVRLIDAIVTDVGFHAFAEAVIWYSFPIVRLRAVSNTERWSPTLAE